MQNTRDSIVIVGAKRTPIGAFNGSLAAFRAPELGAIAIRAAVAQAGVDPASVDEAIMGLCLFANVGQAPAQSGGLAIIAMNP